MIELSVETDDPGVATDLAASNTSGFQLTLEKESSRQGAFETKHLFDFLLEVSAGVTAEMIAHYVIRDVLPRVKKLRVNGVPVTSEAECKAALGETVDKAEPA